MENILFCSKQNLACPATTREPLNLCDLTTFSCQVAKKFFRLNILFRSFRVKKNSVVKVFGLAFPSFSIPEPDPDPQDPYLFWERGLGKRRWWVNECTVLYECDYECMKKKKERKKSCSCHQTFKFFWPPESESVSHRYGSDPAFGSGSFYHQANIVRKTFISAVFWLLCYFLSLRMM